MPANVALGTTASALTIPATRPAYRYQSFRDVSSDPTTLIAAARPQLGKLHYPPDMGKYYISFSFHNYTRPTVFSRLNLPMTHEVALPIPPELVDRLNTAYSIRAEGADAFVAEKTLQGLGYLSNNLRQNRTESTAAKSIADSIGTAAGIVGGAAAAGPLGAVVGGALGGVIGGTGTAIGASALNLTTLGRTFLQSMGVAVNPFLTVLLEGPNFKRHRFSWILLPKTKEESVTIRKIEMLFRKNMSVGLAVGGALYSYPKVIRPRFMPNGNDYLYEFKWSVIEDVNVQYTNATPAFFAETGAPVVVKFEVNLLEIELWTTEDFGEQKYTSYTADG